MSCNSYLNLVCTIFGILYLINSRYHRGHFGFINLLFYIIILLLNSIDGPLRIAQLYLGACIFLSICINICYFTCIISGGYVLKMY